MKLGNGMWQSIILSLASISSWALAQDLPLIKRGTINIGKPAYLELDRSDENAPYRLLINSFRMFGADGVSCIENIGANLTSVADAPLTTWTNDVTWPNDIKRVPVSVFGENYFVIAGGFLVPGKSQGALSLYDLTQQKIIRKLSTPKKDYWYHSTLWVDMNGDGKLDVLTARAKKSLLSSGTGEILWFEQPSSPFQDKWTEHVIAQGPDVNFIYEDLDGDGKPEILAPEFFGGKLTLLRGYRDIWTASVVDAKMGKGFALSLVDLNGDGRKEVLVTNHEALGSVFAYEIPQDLTKALPWTRHTLLSGIPTTSSGFGQASPGKAIAFFPNSRETSGKPHIIVAGDGSQKAHLLIPVSTDPKNWNYREQIVMSVRSGVIGQIAVADVDGDGKSDIFIPAYDENMIHIFTVQ